MEWFVGNSDTPYNVSFVGSCNGVNALSYDGQNDTVNGIPVTGQIQRVPFHSVYLLERQPRHRLDSRVGQSFRHQDGNEYGAVFQTIRVPRFQNLFAVVNVVFLQYAQRRVTPFSVKFVSCFHSTLC